MAVLKCKMCGGELSFEEGASVCECEYCGCKQTVPNIDDEKKVKQYVRANKLRAACDFDKAAGVYESIIEDYEEEAEAYWGLVLCKYGIEYVTDPATANKVPTCHRSSFDCVLDDEDFEMVMETSDAVSRAVYREQAKDIEEIRKKIIEVSGKEEPYDIFICYKELGEDGQRTLDSVLAQSVYDAFTTKGYRVFFSRITLEDKLGQEYEPYIFAALNSARVMLAFGTSYDNYNAVWVKNEWSRYLKLMEKDKSKYLIPCYKDIDAYDMPTEFRHLQGQDMSKIGFIQDLVRGVEKIIPLEKNEVVKNVETVQVAPSFVPNVASLLERAEIFLEDEKWDSVDEYCERVLDIEPKNSKAYLFKVCIQYKMRTPEELVILEEKFEESDPFRKAVRFSDDKMKQYLNRIVEKANQHRLEEEEKIRKEEEKRIIEEELRRIEEEKKRKEDENRREANKQRLKGIRGTINSLGISLIVPGYSHTVGLCADGRVLGTGDNEWGQCNVSEWTDVISVASNDRHTIGIRADGNVVTAGDCEPCRLPNVENCTNRSYHTACLKADGSVIAIGNNEWGQCNVSGWRNIISVVCGPYHTVGLKADGTVVATGNNKWGQCNVFEWTDIVSVVCRGNFTVGLKADGRVVASGYNGWGQCNVSGWTDVISVACSSRHTVGLKANGSIVATGDDKRGQCTVDRWTGIVSVACSSNRTIGLKEDGSVVATNDEHGWFSVPEWEDIISIASGPYHTLGIKADGSVIATGGNGHGQCNVFEWKLFRDENQLREMVEKRATCIEVARKKAEENRLQEERQAEERRRQEEEKRRQEEEQKKVADERRARNVCQYCGSSFKGLFSKKCSNCGKAKDY